MEKGNLSIAVLMAEAQENRCVSTLSLDPKTITVVGEAIGLAASKRLLRLADPNVAMVVMNGSIAGCLRLVSGLTRACDVPVLVLSLRDERLYAERALCAGARGFVMADALPQVLMAAIRTVSQGDVYLSSEAQAKVLERFCDVA